MSEEFPYTTPDGSEARCFIQWKGTNLCMDLHCPCGEHSHIDEDFVYAVRCPACGVVYEMGTQVILRRNDAMAGEAKDALDDADRSYEVRQSIVADGGTL